MGRVCAVCNSEHREEIDAALAAGKSELGTAREHGLSRESVRWHRKHLVLTLSGATILRERAEDEAQRADALVASVQALAQQGGTPARPPSGRLRGQSRAVT